MQRLGRIAREYMFDALKAVAPVVMVIVALSFSAAPVPNGLFLSFLLGAALLCVGMGMFSLGVEVAMEPIGERIGTYITKSRRLWIVALVSFAIGIVITVSEPDLQVLAGQIPSVPDAVLILSVAVGVGVFLVVALLRMLFSVPISHVLIACYAVVFALSAFVPREFLAVAFDAGGVTTGPMTVPFIMALGMGVASIRSDKHASDDSFGLVGLSSVGPILTVMVLGLLYKPGQGDYATAMPGVTEDTVALWRQYTDPAGGFLHYAEDVAMALAPIAVFFLIFQAVGLRMKRQPFLKILIGLLYCFVGLVLFLTGVNVGFMPTGNYLGGVLAGFSANWVIVPIAMVIGYFIVAAEPAVHVLNKQVEAASSGAIPARAMNIGLSIGMCASLGLSMARLLTGAPIMAFLLPGYALSLALSFFVPKMFTAIAFDSGGVASGPMTATFLLPFAIGVCRAIPGREVSDAFGVVAMVAMTPLITIQVMGFLYKSRIRRMEAVGVEAAEEAVIE
jgi:hypothetical protein